MSGRERLDRTEGLKTVVLLYANRSDPRDKTTHRNGGCRINDRAGARVGPARGSKQRPHRGREELQDGARPTLGPGKPLPRSAPASRCLQRPPIGRTARAPGQVPRQPPSPAAGLRRMRAEQPGRDGADSERAVAEDMKWLWE